MHRRFDVCLREMFSSMFVSPYKWNTEVIEIFREVQNGNCESEAMGAKPSQDSDKSKAVTAKRCEQSGESKVVRAKR